MNQQKIGSFLRKLRQEKAITQEQLAEILNVSRRTVSRWETGSNMPDLDILMEIAEYYEVDIREIFDGERKSEKMNQETKETVLQVADYTNEEKLKYTKRLHIWYIIALLSFIVYFATLFLEPKTPSALFDFAQGMLLGISFAMIVVGVLMTGSHGQKLREEKIRLIGKVKGKNKAK